MDVYDSHFEMNVRLPGFYANRKSKFWGFPKIYIAAFTSLLSIIACGMSSSYTATAGISMMKPNSGIKLTVDELSWVASLTGISVVFGGPVSGYLSHKLGRKSVMIYSSLPHVLGWLMIAYADSVPWIYCGRIVTGFCVGMVFVTVPTYVTEISPPKIRGFLGSWFNGAFSVGILIVMGLGSLLPWTWLAISGAVVVVLFATLIVFMPDSPHSLISKNFESEAIKSLEFLRGTRDFTPQDIRKIVDIISKEPKAQVRLREFLNPVLYKPLLIALALIFLQQFSGINAIMSYTVQIFQESHTSLDPHLATILVATSQVLSTFVASVLMDRAGRRIMLLTSGVAGSSGMFMLGLYGLFASHDSTVSMKYGWIPVCGLMLFVFAFALGYGPIPWIVASEMVPTHARSMVVSIVSFAGGLFMFAVVKSFDFLRVSLGGYGVYILYGCFSLVGSIICYIVIPETKGKPLEEIQLLFVARGEKNKLNAFPN